jgi:hypothetical protein
MVRGRAANHTRLRYPAIFPENDLKMGNLPVADVDRHAVKPEIRNVMLAAGIKTSADLDPQILHGFIQHERFRRQPGSQFPGKTTRRGNAQFAGVCSRAGRDVDNSSGLRERSIRYA